jgi:hypothetical protein
MWAELFRDFWWLLFPILGMVMAVWTAIREARAADAVMARARRQLEAGQ